MNVSLLNDEDIDVSGYDNRTVFTKHVKPCRIMLYFMGDDDLVALEKSLRRKVGCPVIYSYYEEVDRELRRRIVNKRRIAQEA
jgi:hypothetical protein